MKYQVTKKAGTVEIRIDDVEGKERQLLDAVQDCQEGRCTCPTQEYQKLDSLQFEQVNGEINLRLYSKEGAELDQADIEHCLEYTKMRLK